MEGKVDLMASGLAGQAYSNQAQPSMIGLHKPCSLCAVDPDQLWNDDSRDDGREGESGSRMSSWGVGNPRSAAPGYESLGLTISLPD